MSRKKMQSWESDISNIGTYQMWFDRLKDYALNMFHWDGMPDEINKRFLELTMFEQGSTVFFKDPDLMHMCMPVMTGGRLNYYREPIEYTAQSFDYRRDLDVTDSVIIWNNYARTPIVPVVRAYAYRLYQVEKTMDVNINAQKTPVMILTDDKQRLTMQNLYMQFDGNEPFIFGNKKGYDKDAVQVLSTEAPFVSDKLMEYKHNLWNEAMTFFGVGNAKQDKKERLVSDEVAANDEQIQMSRYNMLNARQDACEKINKMFGLNVKVDFRLNYENEKKDKEAIEAQEKMKVGVKDE